MKIEIDPQERQGILQQGENESIALLSRFVSLVDEPKNKQLQQFLLTIIKQGIQKVGSRPEQAQEPLEESTQTLLRIATGFLNCQSPTNLHDIASLRARTTTLQQEHDYRRLEIIEAFGNLKPDTFGRIVDNFPAIMPALQQFAAHPYPEREAKAYRVQAAINANMSMHIVS